MASSQPRVFLPMRAGAHDAQSEPVTGLLTLLLLAVVALLALVGDVTVLASASGTRQQQHAIA
jgi:hypothetical protein